MSPPLLHLQNITLSFGSTPLLEQAELSVGEGERICIVGRNGSGKSSLLKVAAGLTEADQGKRFLQPGVTIRYLNQEPDFGDALTVLDYVKNTLAPGDDPYRASLLLSEVGLTGEEKPSTLSGGEARRASLARALAPQPDIILLDEPTNHLDIQIIEWLEKTLMSMRSAIVVISHDRRFLTHLSRKTVWIDRGKTKALDIGFERFETWRDEFLAQEELEHHKLARKLEREADWLRYGVTARRKRNVKRLDTLHGLREKYRTARHEVGQAKLQAAAGQVSGKLVIEAEDISKRFGEHSIIDHLSLKVARGDRLGIIGPNGAGKTTLVNLLTGKLAPDTGQVKLGTNIEMANLEQNRDSLKPEWTIADALTGGNGDLVVINGQAKHVAAYMQDFLFIPEQIRTPVKVLSGGERARLMLARSLAKPSNLLVLDEPTNDLDLETLDVLEEMLSNYTGTIILISHDRDFLDRIVTSVVTPDVQAHWVQYAGGYSDMLLQRNQNTQSRKPIDKKSSVKTSHNISLKSGEKIQTKQRLSFNEKHALETLPKQIATFEKEIVDLQAKLTDPKLYAKDRTKFEDYSMRLKTTQDNLTKAEERWLELELLSESLTLQS